MAWNNNSGGPWGSGGGSGGNGGGPWSGGGGGNKGGGNNPFGRRPPDMDDVIRKGQERLKNLIPGGMGSIKGAVIAGLLLTQVQSISSLFISPVWSDPLLFAIMVAVLMWRPQGLFGRLGHG